MTRYEQTTTANLLELLVYNVNRVVSLHFYSLWLNLPLIQLYGKIMSNHNHIVEVLIGTSYNSSCFPQVLRT